MAKGVQDRGFVCVRQKWSEQRRDCGLLVHTCCDTLRAARVWVQGLTTPPSSPYLYAGGSVCRWDADVADVGWCQLHRVDRGHWPWTSAHPVGGSRRGDPALCTCRPHAPLVTPSHDVQKAPWHPCVQGQETWALHWGDWRSPSPPGQSQALRQKAKAKWPREKETKTEGRQEVWGDRAAESRRVPWERPQRPQPTGSGASGDHARGLPPRSSDLWPHD